jgi:hypothetical protein
MPSSILLPPSSPKGAQPRLDLRNADQTRLTFRRPMLGMNAAKAVTGFNEDEVLSEIALGRIKWAFDLSTQAGEMKRKKNQRTLYSAVRTFVAILTRSLVAYCDPALAQPDTEEQVADLVLPPSSKITGNLRGTELQFAFNVTSEHVLNLIRAGLLKESSRSNWHQGRGGSPTIVRTSVVDLLKTRRLR